jgi:hypothetical protein
MLSKVLWKLLSLMFLIVFHLSTALTQAGIVEGTVKIRAGDGTLKPASGALVDIYRVDIKGHWDTKTDRTGHYVHLGLPLAGTFVFIVSGPGIQPTWAKDIRLGQSPSIDFVANPGDGNTLTIGEVLAIREPSNKADSTNSGAPPVELRKNPVDKTNDRPDTITVVGAGKRFALVVGNGAYNDAPLRNPANDARDVAQALRRLGFQVIERENLNKRGMEEAIRIFGKNLKAGGAGLFYFSGHGAQVNGRNYLVPIGHNIEKEQDVEFEAVDAGRILAEMEAAENQVNILILDACRNNPFTRSFRSGDRGLALMKALSGTIIAYSTAPGSVASDGEGENGLYTQELLNSIQTPALKIEDVFKRVRLAVKRRSNGKQIPWETSALEGDFYFVR